MKKLVLLLFMMLGNLSFAYDSVYEVKSGMLACHEKSMAINALSIVLTINNPKSKKLAQKLLNSNQCIAFAPKEQFIILEKQTKGSKGAYMDYLKIRKIKDNNKNIQKKIDEILARGSEEVKRELHQILTGWVVDVRTSEKSTMYYKVK